MSKCAFNHLYDWGPRLRLGRPTSVLVIKCTTLLTCIENSYCTNSLKCKFKFISNGTEIHALILTGNTVHKRQQPF
jgi:hypothetical protein